MSTVLAFRELSATCVSLSKLDVLGKLGVREHRACQHFRAEPGDGRELSIAQVGVAEICIGESSSTGSSPGSPSSVASRSKFAPVMIAPRS
jgi:hypothetical protein